MHSKIDRFFIPYNEVSDISTLDYQKAECMVNAVKAFAKTTYQGIYIIDYFRKDFLYVSDNLGIWCGTDAQTIKRLGYQFYIDFVPSREVNMLLEINRKGFELFESFPIEERLQYSISYDFHLRFGHGMRMICHRLTPMLLTSEGRIWLAICSISLSSQNSPGNIRMHKEDSNTFHEYSLTSHEWIMRLTINLSEVEREILTLSGQGYTVGEMAERLNKSQD